MKFGISFNLTAFNQAGALVHVYKDGSVLINHGGTEMGQGLHTKMLQVAATALGLPLEKVRLAPDAHRQGAQHLGHRGQRRRRPQRRRGQERLRADPRAAGAVRGCSGSLPDADSRRSGLRPRHPTQFVGRARPHAYHQRIQLWAAGFYKTEGLSWDVDADAGPPFKYFAYGAAVAEVEVDGFTGAYDCAGSTSCTTSATASPRWSTSARSRAGSCRAPAG